MPFPLFHALAYKQVLTNMTEEEQHQRMVLSMLPDFLGVVNVSLWDRMHDKARLQEFKVKYGANIAIHAIENHLVVDALFDQQVYEPAGRLYENKQAIEKQLFDQFQLEGKANKDFTEFIIELSFDLIAVEKYDLLSLFAASQKTINVEETAMLLKKFLQKSKRRIKKYLLQLKEMAPTDLISIDGLIILAKKQYTGIRNIIRLSKRVKSEGIGGFLSSAKFVHRVIKDKVYRDAFKGLVEANKMLLKEKFDTIFNEIVTALQRSRTD